MCASRRLDPSVNSKTRTSQLKYAVPVTRSAYAEGVELGLAKHLSWDHHQSSLLQGNGEMHRESLIKFELQDAGRAKISALLLVVRLFRGLVHICQSVWKLEVNQDP
jgi:hypothetical protein